MIKKQNAIKKSYVKLLLSTLITVFIIALMSCDGRKSKHQALSESIETFRKEITIQIDTYEPEAYMEHKVDTLLSNGFRVSINVFSDMNKNVVFTEIKDTINYKRHYRNFKFDIAVEKGGEQVYNESFNKDDINTLFKYNSATKPNNDDYDFDKLGVLKSIVLNDNPSTSEDIKIEVLYTIPNTNRQSLHTLIINDKGLMKVQRIQTN